DVRNVAIGADQDPKPLRCQNLSGMSTAHMIEEPAVVFQAAVGHSIAWMQVSERTAVGKGTCAVVQRQLIGRVWYRRLLKPSTAAATGRRSASYVSSSESGPPPSTCASFQPRL